MYVSGIGNDEAPVSQTAFAVDWMTLDDLTEVVEIEEVTGLNRWGYDSYRRELLTNPRAIMLVARAAIPTERGILGFFAGWTVEDELHINNIASHPNYRRIGVGYRLLETALDQGARRGISRVFLEVRASNETAQSLYRKFGFKFVNRRRDYYRFPTEDAFVMKLDLYD
jgi:ribosomal-protein-alanine N-acetyltransferase